MTRESRTPKVKPSHNAKCIQFKEGGGGGGEAGRGHGIHIFVQKPFPTMSKEEVTVAQ